MSYKMELVEALTEYSDGDKRLGLELFGSILEDIQAEGIDCYKRELIDECIEACVCPECFGELVVTSVGEDITEAWGRKEIEVHYALICESCGGLVDDN